MASTSIDRTSAPSANCPVSNGIHPDNVSLLPDVMNGPATDPWYVVIIGVTPGVYHDWLVCNFI